MSSKRKLEHDFGNDESHVYKKSRSNKEQLQDHLKHDCNLLIDAVMKPEAEVEDIEGRVQFALDFLVQSFPIQFEQDLPPLIHLHQIYAIVPSRTQVDRQIENLRSQKLIHLFKFDTAVAGAHAETLICFADKFKNHVINRIKSLPLVNKMLIDNFLKRILVDESHHISIEKSQLIFKHQLSESQISILVQNGLLAIKDSSRFWFAVPGIGEFRRKLVEARKSTLDILRRQRYKEMNVQNFFDYLNVTKNKNFRNVNKMNTSYVICDLIGNDLVSQIDSPMGLTIRLN